MVFRLALIPMLLLNTLPLRACPARGSCAGAQAAAKRACRCKSACCATVAPKKSTADPAPPSSRRACCKSRARPDAMQTSRALASPPRSAAGNLPMRCACCRTDSRQPMRVPTPADSGRERLVPGSGSFTAASSLQGITNLAFRGWRVDDSAPVTCSTGSRLAVLCIWLI